MFKKVKLNHSGQSLVEYLLILIVTVSIVLALSSLVFKPFQKYIQSVMGTYIECLLETGELPSLGSDVSATSSECAVQFKNAIGDFSNKVKEGSADKNSMGSKSNSGNKDNESNNKKNSDKKKSSAATVNTGSNNLFAKRNAPSGMENRPSKKKSATLDLHESENQNKLFNAKTSQDIIIIRKKRVSSDLSYGNSADIKKEIEERSSSSGTRILDSTEVKEKTKKIQIEKNPEKPKPADEDKPLTFGDFIRILFIAAIIIALFLLIGGQALQMSKSD